MFAKCVANSRRFGWFWELNILTSFHMSANHHNVFEHTHSISLMNLKLRSSEMINAIEYERTIKSKRTHSHALRMRWKICYYNRWQLSDEEKNNTTTKSPRWVKKNGGKVNHCFISIKQTDFQLRFIAPSDARLHCLITERTQHSLISDNWMCCLFIFGTVRVRSIHTLQALSSVQSVYFYHRLNLHFSIERSRISIRSRFVASTFFFFSWNISSRIGRFQFSKRSIDAIVK